MDSTLLLILIFVLDLIVFGLAVAAEQRKVTATINRDAEYNYCVYESDVATGLRVGSFLFLLSSQLLIMFASRCLCCGRALRPGKSRAWAIVLFITSWVTLFIAKVCLLAASVRNAYHTKYRTYMAQHPPSLEVLRILMMLPKLFDHQDQNVRASSKGLTLDRKRSCEIYIV